MKEMAKIICGYRAVGENYNSLWDTLYSAIHKDTDIRLEYAILLADALCVPLGELYSNPPAEIVQFDKQFKTKEIESSEVGQKKLIDTDELLKHFRYGGYDTEYDESWIPTVRRIIKEQPTAYDVDKVLKELEEHFNATDNADMRLAYHHAIQTVKRGGISNDI